MNLHELLKITDRKKKRLGRGLGSGKGKTGGRGTKGQKARGKVPQGFTGENLPLYKKLPFRRGLGNRKVSVKAVALDITKLNGLKANTDVTAAVLSENKLINIKQAGRRGIKLVGKGPLTVALNIKLPISKSATEAVTKAGGSVE